MAEKLYRTDVFLIPPFSVTNGTEREINMDAQDRQDGILQTLPTLIQIHSLSLAHSRLEFRMS